MKKHIIVVTGVLFLSVLCMACRGNKVTEISETAENQQETTEEKKKVGVLMPTKTDERWEYDAENIKKALEGYGYEVVVEFAVNNSYTQNNQMNEMLDEGVDCLVVSSINSEVLKDTLQRAKNMDVGVIAYDRLLMDTDAVSYYATFDNKGVGVSIGSYIKEKENLDEVRKQGKHKTIEFFMGSYDDNNALFVYDGIMQVLEEYLEDGTLVCKSKRTEFSDTAVMRWSPYIAEKDAIYTLRCHYKMENVDILCCANDSIASGIILALEKEGYTKENWPLLTGQDAGAEAVKNIIAEKQTMTVYKDTRLLADKCATMVKAELEGGKAEINNEDTYDNGVFKVPSYLCTGVAVDKENYKEILVDSGYYEMSQLK